MRAADTAGEARWGAALVASGNSPHTSSESPSHAPQLVTAADCGMPVDSLLVECGFLFVGVSEGHSSAIKVWNLGAGGAQHTLTGHTVGARAGSGSHRMLGAALHTATCSACMAGRGLAPRPAAAHARRLLANGRGAGAPLAHLEQGQVLALAVSPANGYLFSGGLDAAIRVWELNSASGQFQCTATLCRDSGGGHRAAVHTLLVAGQFFFSGDRNGELKVWSLAEGACVQTIERAHDGPIMKMLLWGEVRVRQGAMFEVNGGKLPSSNAQRGLPRSPPSLWCWGRRAAPHAVGPQATAVLMPRTVATGNPPPCAPAPCARRTTC